MIDSTLYKCSGCGAAVIGQQTCGDPTRRGCASRRHEPWCTDHLSEDRADPLTEGADECFAVVQVLEPRDSWRGVDITVSLEPGQLEPMLTIESNSRPLTVLEAEALYADLRAVLDRVKGQGS